MPVLHPSHPGEIWAMTAPGLHHGPDSPATDNRNIDKGPAALDRRRGQTMLERIKNSRTARGEEGFTLIELLVVIIILGILAAVVVFAVGGVGDKGQSASCKIDTRTIRTAEEAYNANNTGKYATVTQLKDAGLLSEVSKYHATAVVAPVAPATSETFTISVLGDRTDGTSSCTVPAGGAAGQIVNGTAVL